MLHHPTLEKLQTLRLSGMHKALTEQMDLPDSETLSFEEHLGLLADRELNEREDRRMRTRLRQARRAPPHCAGMLNLASAAGCSCSAVVQRGRNCATRRQFNVNSSPWNKKSPPA